MRQLRLILVAVLVIATTAQRFRGMLLGLTIIAVNELVHQLLQLRGPSGRRRPRRWLRWMRRPAWLRLPAWLRPKVWTRRGDFTSYERIVGEIAWARYSRRDFDLGLRRRLLEAARVRLAEGHGLDLDLEADRETARRLLGDEAWSLLGPGRLPSDDRNAAGIDLRELEHMVTAIERLNSAAGVDTARPGDLAAQPQGAAR